jgi:hypothetical protein
MSYGAKPRLIDPKVLDRVLERSRAQGKRGVVVFDLDSTLLDNRARQARILAEYGKQHSLATLSACRPEHWEGWDIKVAMKNAGLPPADVERHAEAAKAFWRERFFTSEYCVADEPIAGAAEYLAAVEKTGARIAYCTGRHEPMREGSVRCFERHHFPVPNANVHLLMKPTFEMTDDDWKVEAYQRLRGLGEVVAVFDNEPTHVNGYRGAFPSATIVHLATDDSGRPVEIADGVVSVPSFRR